MPKHKNKKRIFRNLPWLSNVGFPKLPFGFGCCTSTSAVDTPMAGQPTVVDADVNTAHLGGSSQTGSDTITSEEQTAALHTSASGHIDDDAPQIETFGTVAANESQPQPRLETIEEEITVEELDARSKIIKFLRANKERAAQVNAERAEARRQLALQQVAAARQEELRRQLVRQERINNQAGQSNPLFVPTPKHAKRMKIVKWVLMVIAGIALLAVGAWIIKGWLAARAAEAAAQAALPVLTPAAPVFVPPIIVNNLPNVPVITPTLNTIVQNMPSLPDMTSIPTPHVAPSGLDALARVRIYMGG